VKRKIDDEQMVELMGIGDELSAEEREGQDDDDNNGDLGLKDMMKLEMVDDRNVNQVAEQLVPERVRTIRRSYVMVSRC